MRLSQEDGYELQLTTSLSVYSLTTCNRLLQSSYCSQKKTITSSRRWSVKLRVLTSATMMSETNFWVASLFGSKCQSNQTWQLPWTPQTGFTLAIGLQFWILFNMDLILSLSVQTLKKWSNLEKWEISLVLLPISFRPPVSDIVNPNRCFICSRSAFY